MKNKFRYIVFIIIFIAGFSILMYPNAKQWIGEYQQSIKVKEFKTKNKQYEELYDQMKSYNQRIYLEKQRGLKDAWSYEENEFDFTELNTESDMIGYISIDAMNITLPLYVGATKENMNQGAVVLGQTSMPIGGNHTNSVIAAHRGTYTSAMFRDIENLEIGDSIEITNLWETLKYEVIKCIVVSEDDIEAIKIIDDADMITLMSCHPYPHNYQRYVVYAKRANTDNNIEIPFESIKYESSKGKLQFDRLMNMGSIFAFISIFMIFVIVTFYRNKKR